MRPLLVCSVLLSLAASSCSSGEICEPGCRDRVQVELHADRVLRAAHYVVTIELHDGSRSTHACDLDPTTKRCAGVGLNAGARSLFLTLERDAIPDSITVRAFAEGRPIGGGTFRPAPRGTGAPVCSTCRTAYVSLDLALPGLATEPACPPRAHSSCLGDCVAQRSRELAGSCVRASALSRCLPPGITCKAGTPSCLVAPDDGSIHLFPDDCFAVDGWRTCGATELARVSSLPECPGGS